MIDLKGVHYPKSIILHAVFFHIRYVVSYRDLEEILADRRSGDMDGRMVIQGGGLPIKFGTALVVGIGVGGAPSGDIDVGCAVATAATGMSKPVRDAPPPAS